LTNPYLGIDRQTPLPSPDQVRAWWDEYAMLPNIKDHSEKVCQVALLIAGWLIEAGVGLRLEAVEAGALCHDIAKTQCLGTRRRHSDEGAEIVGQKGYPELAYLVRNHVWVPPEHPLDETMVVTYADKRVNHDRVVSLKERFEYILGNYGAKYPEHIPHMEKGRDQTLAVEKKIFKTIGNGHTPAEINRIFNN
jgi:uncharacterized protein